MKTCAVVTLMNKQIQVFVGTDPNQLTKMVEKLNNTNSPAEEEILNKGSLSLPDNTLPIIDHFNSALAALIDTEPNKVEAASFRGVLEDLLTQAVEIGIKIGQEEK